MKRFSIVVLGGFLMALGLGPDVLAQQGGMAHAFAIKKLDAKKQLTPEYQVSRAATSTPRTREWLDVVTYYETKPEWLDEIAFTYYILLRPRKPGQDPMLLQGDVSYVNIAAGKHKSSMLIHPSTLLRYGDFQAVAVVVKIKGQLVAMESNPPSNQRWWEKSSPVAGMVMNRMDTPFAMINFDDYESVKKGGPAQ